MEGKMGRRVIRGVRMWVMGSRVLLGRFLRWDILMLEVLVDFSRLQTR
jgi:hypothetical protein